MSTPIKATGFEPSENQRRLLSVVQDGGYSIPVADACRKAELNRTGTYYRWMEDEAFAAWWIAKATQYFARQLPRVYAALMAAATGKDQHRRVNQAAAKILLDRFDSGFLPATRTEHSGDVDVDVRNMTPEQLEARARVLLGGDG